MGILGSSVRSLMLVTWSPARTTAPVLTSGREMKDKTTPVPASQVCEVCVCFSHSQKLCREMKDKTTPVPASQVCERVCVFQSFSETVQRDEGQNYSCTCQPGVWAVCVFQSFSETVQRDEGQNYSCTCQPGVWACVCVCFSHSQITVQRDEGQNYSCTCQPGVWVCVCFSHSQKLCREMKDKTTLYLPARCVSMVCVFQSFSETVQRDEGQNYSCTCQPGVWACVCFSHSQKLCREMKDKTTAVPASQVCERVCVFQSFSETVQRDEGQNYTCTCQPGVWVCVCVFQSFSDNCAERWRTKLQLYLPARCVSVCVCVSVILRNCAERWRTKLQLYLPARCVSVCVCFSHSQKLCREMKDKTTPVPASQCVCERVCVFQSFSDNCAERWRTKLQLYLPARCVSVCVCFSHSQITVQRDEGQNYSCTCQPGVGVVCVPVILRNCAERWRTKLQLYLSARCVCVCVFQSFSETVQRDEGQNYTCTCQPGVWACVCFSHSQKLCREMKDKTTAVPASQVCERVCVFQSFSETVQRDEGQNYSCTCQPGVWACVCVSVILRNCAERWRTKLHLYLPARCVSMCVCFSHSQKLCREMKDKTTPVPASQVCVCVCVSVILRNCAERWRTKLQLYLPARCVSVCVFQSFSETVCLLAQLLWWRLQGFDRSCIICVLTGISHLHTYIHRWQYLQLG